MNLIADLAQFRKELQAMNRKLDQIINLLTMLVEMQIEERDGDDGPRDAE